MMTDSFERGENQQPNSNEQPDSQGNSQYTGNQIRRWPIFFLFLGWLKELIGQKLIFQAFWSREPGFLGTPW